MEQLFSILALAGVLGCIIFALKLRREKKQLDRLTAQIEHFLLYSQEPLKESLSEGSVANLCNQISRLEQLLILQQKTAVRREQQTTRFVENMAHQMKNTLTALQIQMDILALHSADDGLAPLQKSQVCMNRLTNEIDKILKSSQLADGKIRMAFEAVDLREELAACRERLMPIAGMRNVTIKIEGPKSLILSADTFWLSQALENVMKNAVEHTAPGSIVTVSCSDEGRNSRIQIMDQGDGIPPDELVTLFERFHRGKTAKAGYGIGLSMARDVIAAHHGTISARNHEDRGAMFEIVLPVLDDAKPYVFDNYSDEV